MSNRKIRPGDLDIARPCLKNWNDMQGDDKKRFCKFCKKHVHDVTGMPEDEFRKLMKEKDVKACITIIRGSTNTTPSRFNKPIRWLFTATFLFTGIAGFILDKKRLPITEKIFPLFDKLKKKGSQVTRFTLVMTKVRHGAIKINHLTILYPPAYSVQQATAKRHTRFLLNPDPNYGNIVALRHVLLMME